MDDEKDRTLWVGNLYDKVTEEILYELFLQAGPLQKVKIPSKDGQSLKYAFVTFKHACSVPYTIQLMDGITLFGKPLRLQSRTGSVHQTNGYQGSPSSQDPRYGYSPNASPRHPYGLEPPVMAMQRSNSWQGSSDRDRSRSRERGQSSGSKGQTDNRDLSVISLTGQYTPTSPMARDMDPLSSQLRRERILHQQNASLDVHRHRHHHHHLQNPYDRGSRQPWQQSSYRR